MDLKEIAELVNWTRDYVKAAIETGVELPVSKVKILHTCNKNKWDVRGYRGRSRYIFRGAFEKEQPGRKPPVIIVPKLIKPITL
jgi:hypothetical protein